MRFERESDIPELHGKTRKERQVLREQARVQDPVLRKLEFLGVVLVLCCIPLTGWITLAPHLVRHPRNSRYPIRSGFSSLVYRTKDSSCVGCASQNLTPHLLDGEIVRQFQRKTGPPLPMCVVMPRQRHGIRNEPYGLSSETRSSEWPKSHSLLAPVAHRFNVCRTFRTYQGFCNSLTGTLG